MMRFYPSISGLLGYGIAFCCSLSALVLPDRSIAQTAPAHSCIAHERSVGGVITISAEDCDYDIKLTGRQSDSDDNCNALTRSIEAGEEWETNTAALPSKICIEYGSLARQNEAGYQACTSIADNLADCGGNTSGIVVLVPLALSSTRISPSTTSISLDEGTSRTFTVALDSQPFADTTLSLSSVNPDTTLSPTTLAFTTSNWNQAQTVTLTLAQDGDSADDSDTITLASTDGFIPFATIAVTVDDKDTTPTGNIVLSPQSLALEEEEDDPRTFTVRLDRQPDADVTITISSSHTDVLLPATATEVDRNGTRITFNTNLNFPHQLTFTTSNWNRTQSVGIAPRPDRDEVDESVTLTLAASGGISAPNATIAVTIDDNNERSIAAHTCIEDNISNIGNQVLLGNSSLTGSGYPCGKYRVIEAVGMQRPRNECEDYITSMLPGYSYFVSPPMKICLEYEDSLTQAALGYQGCDSVSITDCGSGGGTRGVEIVAPPPLIPDGTLVLSPTGTLAIDEGETGALSVKLSVKPTKQVTVNLSKTVDDITLSDTSLTFTTSNWNTAQSVTVTAVQDDDTNDASDTITLSAGGDGINAPNATKAVTVNDTTPTGTITLDPASTLTIDEGETGSFDVSLSAKPQTNVSITLSKTGSDISISHTSLTFTPSNWNTTQAVTVTTVQDNDTDDSSGSITLSRASGGFIAPDTSLAITIDDTTPTGTITLDPAGTLTIDEGETGTFDVSLSAKPQTNVSITLSKTGSDISISDTSLTFTPSNWNTAQAVTVTTVQDNDTDDSSGSITLSRASGGFIASDISLAITIDDTTPTGTITLDPAGTLTIDEGETGTFDVTLSAKPQTNVSITLSKTGSDISISDTSLTFTPTNWNTAQAVTISTVQDNDTDDSSGSVTLSRASGGFIAPDTSLAITVDDTTPTGTITLDPANTLTIEEGELGSFDVKLSEQPQTNVSITLSKTGSDINLSDTSLTFTPANWNTAKTVTLSTVQDNDTDDASGSVTLKIASGGFIAPDKSLAIVIDDTTPTGRIALDPPGTLTIEEGETGVVGVSLSAKPQTNVSITLSKTGSDITLSHTSLTFTPSDWNTAQNISLGTMQDNDTDDASDRITLEIASGGFKAPNEILPVTIDDTTPTGRIVLTPGERFSVNEGGAGTFGVRLEVKPQTNVVVTLSSPTNPDITLSETSLTFTPANWDRAQNVIVSAASDSDTINDVDRITLAVASGGIIAPDRQLRIEVSDIPAGAIAVIPTGIITVDEGNSTTFIVKLGLGVRPSRNIVVSLSKTNPDITLSESSLTFTPEKWQEERVVGIEAAADSDTANDSDTITIKAVSGIETPDTTRGVSVIDDDLIGSIVLSTRNLYVVEGQNTRFGVQLGAAPSVPSITVSLSNINPQVSFSPDSLTFTPDDFGERQTIAVNTRPDDDTRDGSDTITLSASGGGNYEGIETVLPVFIFDAPGVIGTSVERLGLLEGDPPITFSVSLEVEPTNTDIVVVSLAITNPDITLSPTSLVFTRNAWNTPQSVSIQAADDANLDDEHDTLVLTAAGGNYDLATASISVSIEDDDEVEPPVEIPEQIKGYALAIPPDTASDRSDLRIRCRQNAPCTVYLHCSAQDDGSIFEGWIPDPIPAWGTRTLIAADIVRYTGGSWAGKGRLGCALRSDHSIGIQIWTRSGDGVLVNNSAFIGSVRAGDAYLADIESIPSPEGSDGSNIRISCLAPADAHCTGFSLSCFEDDGTGHEGVLGRIERLTTRHLQADALADLIDHRWQGLELSCELRSDHPFTVQILTRTGGGGALVNNSATGTGE